MSDFFAYVREKEEATLLNFFENTFNLRAIHDLLRIREQDSQESCFPFDMYADTIPDQDVLCGDIFALCRSVAGALGFPEGAIEFHIVNDNYCNSFSIAGNGKTGSHVIVLTRGLIERATIEELRFVVGHEVGHLIFDHSYVSKTIRFIYPDADRQPPLLQKLYDAWNKISEISADRVGLLANGNLGASVKALYRISSGLDGKHLSTDPVDLIGFEEARFEKMRKNSSYIFTSHPARPVRVVALRRFYESRLWKSISSGEGPVEDVDFERSMEEILASIKKFPLNELETIELSFLASAGMFLMVADQDVDDDEYTLLINTLSRYTHWPPGYLDRMDKTLSLIHI